MLTSASGSPPAIRARIANAIADLIASVQPESGDAEEHPLTMVPEATGELLAALHRRLVRH